MLFLVKSQGGWKYGDYQEHMSNIEKIYFVPLSFDWMGSVLAVSISTRLPLDFA